MADNVLKVLLESKTTLEVLGNLLQSTLNTVVVAKSTGKEFKSIFDNVSGSGVNLIDATHAKLGGQTYTLKQLRHALLVILAVASTSLIGYAAYKNPNHFQVIQENLSQIKTNVREKIKHFVDQLDIREVINLIGQSLGGLISQSNEIFDALWKHVSGKIGNFIHKIGNLRSDSTADEADAGVVRRKIPQSSPFHNETLMNPEFDEEMSVGQTSGGIPSRHSAVRGTPHSSTSSKPTLSRKKTVSRKQKKTILRAPSRRPPQMEMADEFTPSERRRLEEMATPTRNEIDDPDGLP